MVRWLPLALALCVALSPAAGADEAPSPPEPVDYGAGITLTDLTRLTEVAADPEHYRGRTVLVRGRVRDVCQRKGCWMVVDDGSAQARVRFADYGFFVPKDCRGQEAWVEGEVSVKTLSAREARHYAGESAHKDAPRVEGPVREIGLTATGVRLVEVRRSR
jgi:hypothetical protein